MRLAELLFDLRLKDVQLVFHVPVDVGEALLRGVVKGMLALLVGEGRYHTLIELLDFGGWILATFISWRTL